MRGGKELWSCGELSELPRAMRFAYEGCRFRLENLGAGICMVKGKGDEREIMSSCQTPELRGCEWSSFVWVSEEAGEIDGLDGGASKR